MDVTQISRRPVLRPKIEFRVLDDLSSVAVDPESGQAHALTPVATAIVERCDGTATTQEIVAEIVEIFDCTISQAEQDVVSFLEDLALKELVDW